MYFFLVYPYKLTLFPKDINFQLGFLVVNIKLKIIVVRNKKETWILYHISTYPFQYSHFSFAHFMNMLFLKSSPFKVPYNIVGLITALENFPFNIIDIL